ncbi:unnamed protein product [Rhizophagus irregularis]|nr:unnamed protein product [Rhizophagus irregularis]CAB5349900.1 unnamed protein product [Rhizophagus irregularis]
MSTMSSEKIESVKKQVEETTKEIHNTLHLLAEKDKKLDELKAQSDSLLKSSARFKPVAVNLHKKSRWKNIKMTIILTVVIILILAAIIVPTILKFQGKL